MRTIVTVSGIVTTPRTPFRYLNARAPIEATPLPISSEVIAKLQSFHGHTSSGMSLSVPVASIFSRPEP